MKTTLSCRRQTRATLCVTRIVLYSKMDEQCDKLVTDERRQFITLSIHLS